MEIREATINDAKRISYLINTLTNKNPNNYTDIQLTTWKGYNTPSMIKKQFEDRTIFCAFSNKKLVGTIGLKNNYVVGFYISHSNRHKGIGSKLLNYIENYALNKNIKTLHLESTSSAIKFYESKGFQKKEKIKVILQGIEYTEVKMKKTIK